MKTMTLKPNTVLAPTHHCFDDAALYIVSQIAERYEQFFKLKLVHAACETPDGKSFAHAWCEQDDGSVVAAFMIEGKHTYIVVDQPRFYKWFNPVDVTTYSVMEAFRLSSVSKDSGPWEQRYRDLCGEGHEVLGKVEVT
jgi:hypothetical protein